MGLYQKALHILCLAGVWGMMRRKDINPAAAALPVCMLGGVLYHMIFEAKAQYIYMYIVLMMPVAAHGLCQISNCLSGCLAGRRDAR